MAKNPFGDDDLSVPARVNPFGDEPEPDNFDEALLRIAHAGRRIRQLRTQLGAEGLTIAATREMMTQLGAALESTARALQELAERAD